MTEICNEKQLEKPIKTDRRQWFTSSWWRNYELIAHWKHNTHIKTPFTCILWWAEHWEASVEGCRLIRTWIAIRNENTQFWSMWHTNFKTDCLTALMFSAIRGDLSLPFLKTDPVSLKFFTHTHDGQWLQTRFYENSFPQQKRVDGLSIPWL